MTEVEGLHTLEHGFPFAAKPHLIGERQIGLAAGRAEAEGDVVMLEPVGRT